MCGIEVCDLYRKARGNQSLSEIKNPMEQISKVIMPLLLLKMVKLFS